MSSHEALTTQFPLLISRARITSRITELGKIISKYYDGKELTLLIVLKGASQFGAMLFEQLPIGTEVEYIRIRSYEGNRSTGQVKFSFDEKLEFRNRHILVIEDIIDTGRTADALCRWMDSRSDIKDYDLCSLLFKKSVFAGSNAPRFVGFELGNHFVVGFGMDYNEKFRNLPDIRELPQELL